MYNKTVKKTYNVFFTADFQYRNSILKINLLFRFQNRKRIPGTRFDYSKIF